MAKIEKRLLIVIFLLTSISISYCQDSIHVLTDSMFSEFGTLVFPDMDNWDYHPGGKNSNSIKSMEERDWIKMDTSFIHSLDLDEHGKIEAWFRIRIMFDSTFSQIPLFLDQLNTAATEVYINGERLYNFGEFDAESESFTPYIRRTFSGVPVRFPTNQPLDFKIHFFDKIGLEADLQEANIIGIRGLLMLVKADLMLVTYENASNRKVVSTLLVTIGGTLTFLFWLIYLINRSQHLLLFIAVSVSCFFGMALVSSLSEYTSAILLDGIIYRVLIIVFLFGIITSMPILISKIFTNKVSKWLYWYAGIGLLFVPLVYSKQLMFIPFVMLCISCVICFYYIFSSRKLLRGAKWSVVVGVVLSILLFMFVGYFFVLNNGYVTANIRIPDNIGGAIFISSYIVLPISLMVYVALWVRESFIKEQKNAQQLIQLTNEKKEIIEKQNKLLEEEVNIRTSELKVSLENLKSTQTQLIHAEKMASLGELTAGIAHEIQNPLNFVNNFSEVSVELTDELREEVEKGNVDEAKTISIDLKNNLQKINHHGKRADSIVKGMLLHSRNSDGEKVVTDINDLCDEYLRLSYHGMRAKNRNFNVDYKTDFDPDLPKIKVVPQDIGRVLLNIFNNAFQSFKKDEDLPGFTENKIITTSENPDSKDKSLPSNPAGLFPKVIVDTKNLGDKIKITISDNGLGIPEDIKDKIFQPFFTTKATGEGTGLGLSLSYDIVKAHRGNIQVKSEPSKGTTFIINLPIAS